MHIAIAYILFFLPLFVTAKGRGGGGGGGGKSGGKSGGGKTGGSGGSRGGSGMRIPVVYPFPFIYYPVAAGGYSQYSYEKYNADEALVGPETVSAWDFWPSRRWPAVAAELGDLSSTDLAAAIRKHNEAGPALKPATKSTKFAKEDKNRLNLFTYAGKLAWEFEMPDGNGTPKKEYIRLGCACDASPQAPPCRCKIGEAARPLGRFLRGGASGNYTAARIRDGFFSNYDPKSSSRDARDRAAAGAEIVTALTPLGHGLPMAVEDGKIAAVQVPAPPQNGSHMVLGFRFPLLFAKWPGKDETFVFFNGSDVSLSDAYGYYSAAPASRVPTELATGMIAAAVAALLVLV